MSHGGLQFYWVRSNVSSVVKAPLAAAISPYLISLTHPTHAWNARWNERWTTTPGTSSPTLSDKCVGSLTSPANHVTLKMQETGPTVYSPYQRRRKRVKLGWWYLYRKHLVFLWFCYILFVLLLKSQVKWYVNLHELGFNKKASLETLLHNVYKYTLSYLGRLLLQMNFQDMVCPHLTGEGWYMILYGLSCFLHKDRPHSHSTDSMATKHRPLMR